MNFPRTRAQLRRLWRNLVEWRRLRKEEAELHRQHPWLVDREGVVYKPTKRVVLRGKS